MPDDRHDSWLSGIGIDVEGIRSAVQSVQNKVSDVVDGAKSLANSAVDAVVDDAKQIYKGAEGVASSAAQAVKSTASAAVQAAQGAGSAVAGAAKKVAETFTPGAASGPMAPDCKPVRGQVPGPAEHVLCGTHGHVLDTKAGTIIAASLEEYKKAFKAGVKTSLPDPAEARKAAEDEANKLKKNAGDIADDLEKDAKKAADTAVEKIKEAGRLAEQLLIKVKALGEAILKDTEGCRLQAVGIITAVGTLSGSIIAFIAACGAAPETLGASSPTAGAAALLGIFSIVGLIAAISSYIDCKNTQLETLRKERAQKEHDAELDEKIKKLEQQVQDINNRKNDIQATSDQIQQLVK